MSQIKVRGKFINLSKETSMDLEELCKVLCIIYRYKGETLPYSEVLTTNREEYFISNGDLYQITRIRSMEEDDYTIIIPNKTEYTFISSFDTTNTDLQEQLADGMDELI